MEIYTLWRTTKACCEVVYGPRTPSRLMVWLGPRLVYEQIVSSVNEAIAVAAELKIAYA